MQPTHPITVMETKYVSSQHIFTFTRTYDKTTFLLELPILPKEQEWLVNSVQGLDDAGWELDVTSYVEELEEGTEGPCTIVVVDPEDDVTSFLVVAEIFIEELPMFPKLKHTDVLELLGEGIESICPSDAFEQEDVQQSDPIMRIYYRKNQDFSDGVIVSYGHHCSLVTYNDISLTVYGSASEVAAFIIECLELGVNRE